MRVGTALIGTGYWGSKLRRYLREDPGCELRMECNSKTNLETVWGDPEIAAVVAAVPNEVRYEIVRRALESGKHVFSEKPLALRLGECERLRDLARAKGRVLFVDYTWMYSEGVAIAKRKVDEGAIGTLRGIDMEVKHLGRFGGGNVYTLLGSHMLSVLSLFAPLGQLEYSRHDVVTVGGVPETGAIHFSGNGIGGQIALSLNYPGKTAGFVLYGDEGTLIFDAGSETPVQITRYGRLRWTVAEKLPQQTERFATDEKNNLKNSVGSFFRALDGGEADHLDVAVEISAVLAKLGFGHG